MSVPSSETFHKFFDCWVAEQDEHLRDLVSASNHHRNPKTAGTTPTGSARYADDSVLRGLVDRVIQHYEHYYRVKLSWAKQDVVAMLSPSWRSSFEDAFLWIGGWRPTTAFHLLYSKSGLQLEDKLGDLIRGLSTGDLADLSAIQLKRVNELQLRTIREEKEVSEKMAKLQETLADSSMVELSHAVSELTRSGGDVGEEEEEERVQESLEHKVEGLEEILQWADDLRLRTLKAVVDILTPIQAVHYLIAAAELHVRLHDWGKKRDARQHRTTGVADHHPPIIQLQGAKKLRSSS